jgi:glycosyltransferase involved in cell wall biosynthesis
VPCFIFGDSNVHCDSTSGWKGRLKALLLPPVLRLSAAILYCGKFGEQYFRRYGVSAERLFRFPYEPDYGRIRNVRPDAIEAARRAYGLQAGRRYLIYSGRLISIKRVDLLLQAFLRIAPLRPNWDLIIAGAGDQLEPLQAMLPAQFVDRVIWTGFINEPDTLAAVYSTAHALVLPSDYEPWGVVVTEAAVRMPVIASSVVGAAADVIADGVNGRIFRAGDVDALQRCLLDVTDPSTLSAMTAAAPAEFAAWHDLSDPVRGLRAALDSVHFGGPA